MVMFRLTTILFLSAMVILTTVITYGMTIGGDEFYYKNGGSESDKLSYNFGKLGKRAYSYVSQYKRLPVYNFGLGKRSPSTVGGSAVRSGGDVGSSRNLYSFGLGKRDYPFLLQPTDLDSVALSDVEQEEPSSLDIYAEEKKRGSKHQYDFGLGKRLKYQQHQYDFGLGKRTSGTAGYNFGLGKRIAAATAGKTYGFGLGKKDKMYSFGLGKRALEDPNEYDYYYYYEDEDYPQQQQQQFAKRQKSSSVQKFNFGLGKRTTDDFGYDIVDDFKDDKTD